jgi:hypothetical protein
MYETLLGPVARSMVYGYVNMILIKPRSNLLPLFIQTTEEVRKECDTN